MGTQSHGSKVQKNDDRRAAAKLDFIHFNSVRFIIEFGVPAFQWLTFPNICLFCPKCLFGKSTYSVRHDQRRFLLNFSLLLRKKFREGRILVKMAIELNQKSDRYSYNQIKQQLKSYIFPVNSLTFLVNQKMQVEMSGEQIVEYILANLPRRQILELLEMLEIIKGRNSNAINYLQYILHGIDQTKIRK